MQIQIKKDLMMKIKLVDVDSKYYETEKQSDQDLEVAKSNLTNEQKKIDTLLSSLSTGKILEHKSSLEEMRKLLNKTIECIDDNLLKQARENLNNINISLSYIIQNLSESNDDEGISKINSEMTQLKNYSTNTL